MDKSFNHNLEVSSSLPPLLPTLTPEMQLLVCCARIEMTEPFLSHMEALIKNGLEWEGIIPLATRHGMIGLLHKHFGELNLHGIPQSFSVQLAQRAKTQRIRQLFLTARMLKISQLLTKADIPHLHYKGIVLDHQLYGGQMLRPTGDMDILVRKEDASIIRAIMVKEGYRGLHATNVEEEKVLLQRHKDYVFVNPENSHMIEAHWRLTTPEVSQIFDWDYYWPTRQKTMIKEEAFETFGAADLCLVLSIHAARHQFEQLRWLCDLGLLIQQNPQLDWETTLRRARQANLGKMVLQAANLAQCILGVELPSKVANEIKKNPKLSDTACKIVDILCKTNTETSQIDRYAIEIQHLDNWKAQVRYVSLLLFNLNTREVHVHDNHPILGLFRYGIRAFQIFRRRGINLILRTAGSVLKNATRS